MSTSDHTTPLKHCNVCGNDFPPTSEFWHKNKNMKDGLAKDCKTCACARARKWEQDNKEYVIQRAHEYYLKNREYILARVRTYAEEHAEEISIRNAAYYLRNKERMNEQSRINRANNLEAYNQRVIKWIADHPERRREIANRYVKTPKGAAARVRRRARKRGLPDSFTAVEWEMCLNWWDDACAYCGECKPLCVDHFIPLASPDCPGTVVDNMVPACKTCNSSKQHREPVEWLATRYEEPEYLEILGRIAAYFDVL